jgi:hypothetical protein
LVAAGGVMSSSRAAADRLPFFASSAKKAISEAAAFITMGEKCD